MKRSAAFIVALVACGTNRSAPAPDGALHAAESAREPAAAAAVDAGAPPAKLLSGHARYEPTEWVSWDQAKGYLQSGRRVVRDGAGDRVVDASDPPLEEVMKMPAPLGRGFVFLGTLDVYVSERFDGPLTPVVKRSDKAGRVFLGVGFDSLYLQYSGEDRLLQFEIPSGKPITLDPPNAKRAMGHPDGFVVAAVGTSFQYAEAPGHWRSLGVSAGSGGINLFQRRLLLDTPGAIVEVERGGKTKKAPPKSSPELFAQPMQAEFRERAAPEISAIGSRDQTSADAATFWDTERLEGDVDAVKPGPCPGSKTPARICLRTRDGIWTAGWLPEGLELDVAIWASKGDKLLGLVGKSGECVLVAPREKRSARLPCPGFTVVAERHGGASITKSGALRIFTGRMSSGLGVTELSLDGGVLEESLPVHHRASIAGRRGLMITPAHELLETADDGHTWVRVAPPPAGVSEVKLANGQPRGWLGRCAEAGCRFYDGTVRVGWALP